ncbi:hypothetical protein TREES_T100013330 [Tupaia chinensis]|uniref:Uncharacterized protein n=1 Tax=Tupaia chinensis TaxID=246437 RepID=L9KHJ5_TUPCH|nr:hypothetical protein TREES_T100013330 [Tupaia chinensis]
MQGPTVGGTEMPELPQQTEEAEPRLQAVDLFERLDCVGGSLTDAMFSRGFRDSPLPPPPPNEADPVFCCGAAPLEWGGRCHAADTKPGMCVSPSTCLRDPEMPPGTWSPALRQTDSSAVELPHWNGVADATQQTPSQACVSAPQLASGTQRCHQELGALH